jgi:glucosamine 6-phosphate synthetase-like amidotransferase/phosphosugar isomerase protein
MCGIAGFSVSNRQTIDARKLSRALLLQIVQRGIDATGMGWTDSAGRVWYVKNDVSARRFISESLHQMDRDAKTVILHTRYATKGSPTIEENNHPIVRPGIVGVHNGMIPNDDEVFDMLDVERYGQVDSEAAFALIEESGLHPTESLTLLDGSVALGWIKTETPDTLHLARWQRSPLAIGQTKRGSVVFASTMPMLMAAGRQAGLGWSMTKDVRERTYLRVRNGIIHDNLPIGIAPQMGSTLALMEGGF